MPGSFYVSDYGAVGNGIADDTAEIQAAIDAAYAAGGGTVYLGAGTYKVSGTSDKSDGALRLLDNVTLQGAGMGVTIIKVQDGNPYNLTGIVRTPFNEITHDVAMYDLTLDGNRANNTMKIDGFYTGVAPGSTRQDYNITVDRVEVKNCSGYGFDPHEQTLNLRIANSVAHHNGLDGFVADFLVNSVYENNLAYANDRHGFNVTTSTGGLQLLNNIARDNGSAGLVIQRGSENIPVPHDITIQGGSYYNNAREGIFVKMADDITITGVNVYGNQRQGIRLDGADNVLITSSSIGNNSQAGVSLYDEIRINRYNDSAGSSGLIFDSTGIRIENSTIYSNLAIKARYGIYEALDVAGYNSLIGNTISGQLSGPTYFAPQLVTPAVNQTGTAGTAFSYQLAANTFFDADQANPTLSATLASGAALPSWLTFNPSTRQFSGNPPADSTLQIVVKATDAQGLSSTTTFNLVVGAGSSGDIVGTSGADTLTGTSGPDNIFGLGGNDTLSGAGGADTLDGGSGSDTMHGGGGDDIYYVNTSTDLVIEAAGGGTDTIRSTNSRTLDANVENGELLGTGAINSTGNALANTLTGNSGVNILTGNAGDDRLFGGAGNDTLKGGTGNDTLDGEAGADRMEGGDGNDLFTVDNTGDTIVEYVNAGAGGVDTVRSTVSFTLASNVENLTLLGTSNINATGNTAANILTGNGGSNILDGGAGVDNLQGGLGNDRLIGGTGSDTIDGGTGQDTAVFAGDVASYTITTSAGSISIRDNDSVTDGNDGTDTLIGVETAEFKGGATVNLLAPIVLDLDGNGVELIDLANSRTSFDFNGDGTQTRTGWIGQGDAFLVFDRDGNGTVSGSSELSFVGDKAGARSDLDGLRAFDSNGDGVLSAADDSFSSFMLWSDGNSDGQVNDGELMGLAQAGIASLSLTGAATERDWAWGENIVVNSGSFLRTDGSSGALADVALLHEDAVQSALSGPYGHESFV